MNRQKKRRKNNFGMKAVTFQYYLSSYYNPNYETDLEEFYHTYFGENTHESYEKKLELLKKMLMENKSHPKFGRYMETYHEELELLCEHAKPLYYGNIKECEVLRGEVVAVKDITGEKKYYRTYVPLLEEEWSPLFEEEQKTLELRRFR